MKPISVNNYSIFSRCYDRVMQYVDFEDWYYYLADILDEFELPSHKLLDIGGGTGVLAKHFSTHGYHIDILDICPEMLDCAKEQEYSIPVALHLGDMLTWLSTEKYSSAFCLHDTVNYLQNNSDLKLFFENCAQNIIPGGGLIIDNCSEYNIIKNFDKNIFNHDFEDINCVWSNNYSKKTRVAEIELQFLDKNNPSQVQIEKHFQRVHLRHEIIEASKTWFDCIGELDGFSFDDIHSKTEEEYYIFRRKNI